MAKRFRTHMGSRVSRRTHRISRQQLTADFRANLGEILGRYDEFVEHIEGVTPEILKQAVTPTMDKAKTYCPKDSGKLVASAYLETESFRGRHVVAVGFGRRGQPDYAVYVHEMPFRHTEPTRSKFLQAALEEDEDQFGERLAAAIKAAAGT